MGAVSFVGCDDTTVERHPHLDMCLGEALAYVAEYMPDDMLDEDDLRERERAEADDGDRALGGSL